MAYIFRNIHRCPPVGSAEVHRVQLISGRGGGGGGGGQKNDSKNITNNQGTKFAQTERRPANMNWLPFKALYMCDAFKKNNSTRALFWSNAEETASTWNRRPYLHIMSSIRHNGLAKRDAVIQNQYTSGQFESQAWRDASTRHPISQHSSQTPNFRPSQIHPKSTKTVPQGVRNSFASV